MKYLLMVSIVISVVVLFGTGTANGLWTQRSESDLLENSQTIFVGNITGVKVITLEKLLTYGTEENGVTKTVVENYTLNVDQYVVDVEEFLKNPQTFDSITVRQPIIQAGPGYLGTIGGFKIGDRVLFYLDKIDGENTYSPESFLIPKPCVGKDTLTQARPEFGGDFTITQNGVKVGYDSIIANKPVLFTYEKDMRTLDGKSFDLMIEISKNNGKNIAVVLSKEIQTGSKPCEWTASAQWGFTPTEGSYNMDINIRENGTITDQSHTRFSVTDNMNNKQLSPLEQFKSGVPIEQIQCKQGLMLVKKHDNSLACIKSSSLSELNFRRVADCVWNCSIPIPVKHIHEDKTTEPTMVIDGKSFYYYTINETLNSARGEGKKISFHNVMFTLFPKPVVMNLGGFCGSGSFRTSILFSDETHESLSINIPEPECMDKFTKVDLTKLTNHTNPQAGLTFYDGKMILLVYVQNQSNMR
jgi:hypothetical protein